MMPKVDVLSKIEDFYMADRPVPYLTFMNVFNDLLSDPVKVAPKEPSEELKAKFRAACMAANVGLIDTEGREEERLDEFYHKVVPVWDAKLPLAEARELEGIRQGKLREERRREAEERAKAATRQAETRSRELLEKLGLEGAELEAGPKRGRPVPEEEAPAEGAPAGAEAVRLPGEEPAPAEPQEEPAEVEFEPAEPPGRPAAEAEGEPLHVDFDFTPSEGEEVAEQVAGAPAPPVSSAQAMIETSIVEPPPVEGRVRRYRNVDELCAAIRARQFDLHYAPRDQAEEFAHYGLDNLDVGVQLAEADGRHYTVLTAGFGRARLGSQAPVLDAIAAEMGYRRMAEYAYMRADGQRVYTLKVGPHKTSIACAAAATEAEKDVLQRIQKIHRDMGELLERLRG